MIETDPTTLVPHPEVPPAYISATRLQTRTFRVREALLLQTARRNPEGIVVDCQRVPFPQPFGLPEQLCQMPRTPQLCHHHQWSTTVQVASPTAFSRRGHERCSFLY